MTIFIAQLGNKIKKSQKMEIVISFDYFDSFSGSGIHPLLLCLQFYNFTVALLLFQTSSEYEKKTMLIISLIDESQSHESHLHLENGTSYRIARSEETNSH